MLIRKMTFNLLLLLATLGMSLMVASCASTQHQESTGEYIDDSALTMKVKAALLADKNIESLGIGVKTYKGVVELSGFVDSRAQKTAATEITRNINGVKAVVDALVVKRTP